MGACIEGGRGLRGWLCERRGRKEGVRKRREEKERVKEMCERMSRLAISSRVPFGLGEYLDLLADGEGQVDVDLHPVLNENEGGRERVGQSLFELARIEDRTSDMKEDAGTYLSPSYFVSA